jgi:hypothetical protein
VRTTGARVRRKRERVTYGSEKPVVHTGRVAHELHLLTGWSIAYCQFILGDGTAIRTAGRIIQAHVNAGDIGATFVKRVKPIERAFANVPHQAYAAGLEIAEQEAQAAQDVEQTRYITEPTTDNARRRIRTIDSHIAHLAGVQRAIAHRHGMRL